MSHVRTWPEVIAQLEPLVDQDWADSLHRFARQVAASEYGKVFFPDLWRMDHFLILSQTKEYDAERGVFQIHADKSLTFTYRDTHDLKHCWQRICPPNEGLSLLAKAVDQLHLLVRYP